ncbi:MAG TPA: 2-amino-4-hydroxy-6-hydroxymethyldihydropteridine diphosphokinase [Candidatus Hydrogenedens sp.]|nr:2-amino-4-hydroxy-6-hydroxymethyldihydropteridine diphosphokinase [Candidatus Hydrogenedens sp.]
MMAYLSIGSNLGERFDNITNAIRKLNEISKTKVKKASNIYETEPVGNRNQPTFLNIAVEIETELSPLELLSEIKKIEYQLGRTPQQERWGPRIIDIDIILYNDSIINDVQLVLPHAEFRNRRFVLQPLADLCGSKVDPITGKTIEELLLGSEVKGKVVKTELKVTLEPLRLEP